MAWQHLHRSTHSSNAAVQHYYPMGIGPPLIVSKPDISPDQRRRIPMKNLFLAAVTALSLSAAVAPVAMARDFHNGSTVAGDAAATLLQKTGAYSPG
jgi:hypothetical protein